MLPYKQHWNATTNMWYVKLSPAVEKFSADVQLSHEQLSRMFSVFKNAFMAGPQPVEGTSIDVDAALTQLEKQPFKQTGRY